MAMRDERLNLGTCAFGRAIGADGAPLDGGPPLCGCSVEIELRSPTPAERVPIDAPLWTGIRVIDGLLALGRGARVGIFGPPGAGKSSLLESIVRGCAADAVVVALVGERGREAQRWIERCHGATTIVCSTSDRTAAERIRAARVAVAHAAALRARHLHVLLVLDSLARFAGALRERSIAAGESAGRGGYPPSVFAEMARLLEVAGASGRGSISLIATVINDGDERDPISEAARSLLDGHIVLSTRLAGSGRFPAVDVPASASRTMPDIVHASHLRAANVVRRAIVLLERIEDARALGVEPSGTGTRAAIEHEDRLEAFLRQESRASPPSATVAALLQLAAGLEADSANR